MASLLSSAAQLGTEALGVQRSHPGSRACTFGTSQFRHCRLLLLYPGDGWKDLPRPLRACSRLWRLAHQPSGEWMIFHFAWVLRLFRSGRRWAVIRPGSGRVPVCSCWGLADSCPGVSVWGSFGGSDLPLGWASGVLGAGCPARCGTWWTRPCWTTLQW